MNNKIEPMKIDELIKELKQLKIGTHMMKDWDAGIVACANVIENNHTRLEAGCRDKCTACIGTAETNIKLMKQIRKLEADTFQLMGDQIKFQEQLPDICASKPKNIYWLDWLITQFKELSKEI